MGKRFAVNADFFSDWSPNMAYILGYFYADGGLENSPNIRGRYIRFTSTDKELIERTRKLMGSEHTIVCDQRTGYKTRYLLRIGNIELYNSMEKIGLTPNKSNTMTLPYIPAKYLSHFLRGYFDGDGCVSIERQALLDGTKSIKRLHTSFTSGSSTFLSDLNTQLFERIGIGSKLYKNSSAWQLRYNTRSSVILFNFMYKDATKDTTLSRKLHKFGQFFNERKNWIDSDIQSILSRTSRWRSG